MKLQVRCTKYNVPGTKHQVQWTRLHLEARKKTSGRRFYSFASLRLCENKKIRRPVILRGRLQSRQSLPTSGRCLASKKSLETRTMRLEREQEPRNYKQEPKKILLNKQDFIHSRTESNLLFLVSCIFSTNHRKAESCSLLCTSYLVLCTIV